MSLPSIGALLVTCVCFAAGSLTTTPADASGATPATASGLASTPAPTAMAPWRCRMHAQDDIALGKSWGVTVYNYAMCLRAAKAEAEGGITRL